MLCELGEMGLSKENVTLFYNIFTCEALSSVYMSYYLQHTQKKNIIFGIIAVSNME